MDPVLRRLSDEGALRTASAGITLHRMTTRPHEVVELRKLDDKRIPVILIERAFLQVILDEDLFPGRVRFFLRVSKPIRTNASVQGADVRTSCF